MLYLTANGSKERERLDTVPVEALNMTEYYSSARVENAGSAWKMTDQIKALVVTELNAVTLDQ